MNIPHDAIPEAYKLAKATYEGKTAKNEALDILQQKYSLNRNSATDYLNNFKQMIEGKKFTRTNNAFATEYFLDHIRADFGLKGLSNALKALGLHIAYYESLQNITLYTLRGVMKKFSEGTTKDELITELSQITQNITTLENAITGADEEDRTKSAKHLSRGICFIVYRINEELRFAPSKFIGYKGNSIKAHLVRGRDGRETNKAINVILNSQPVPDSELEAAFKVYCANLGIKTSEKGGTRGRKRKFWQTEIVIEDDSNSDISEEFPEGKLVERTHRSRERNGDVIRVAKERFRKKHGRLFCQVCRFDFLEKYGKDFIEGHHTIAVKDMEPGHKTRPDDIAMLCSNCHRMVHNRRPWLSMAQLHLLIK